MEIWTLDKGDLANKTFQEILGKGKCLPSFTEIKIAPKSHTQHFYVCLIKSKRANSRKVGAGLLMRKPFGQQNVGWVQIKRAILPPTRLFGHHHPGSGVCLPALAHHTFGQRQRWERRRKYTWLCNG